MVSPSMSTSPMKSSVAVMTRPPLIKVFMLALRGWCSALPLLGE